MRRTAAAPRASVAALQGDRKAAPASLGGPPRTTVAAWRVEGVAVVVGGALRPSCPPLAASDALGRRLHRRRVAGVGRASGTARARGGGGGGGAERLAEAGTTVGVAMPLGSGGGSAAAHHRRPPRAHRGATAVVAKVGGGGVEVGGTPRCSGRSRHARALAAACVLELGSARARRSAAEAAPTSRALPAWDAGRGGAAAVARGGDRAASQLLRLRCRAQSVVSQLTVGGARQLACDGGRPAARRGDASMGHRDDPRPLAPPCLPRLGRLSGAAPRAEPPAIDGGQPLARRRRLDARLRRSAPPRSRLRRRRRSRCGGGGSARSPLPCVSGVRRPRDAAPSSPPSAPLCCDGGSPTSADFCAAGVARRRCVCGCKCSSRPRYTPRCEHSSSGSSTATTCGRRRNPTGA